MLGTLYIVATPIGNLEDITLRALRVLKEVDLIACEDTRQTRKLLTRHDIKTPTISYHQHNERQRSGELIDKLKAGANIALVSDAGTPTISDPGMILIRQAIEEGITVVPIPGPSAVVTALMAAGLPTEAWLFIGFLPAKPTARRRELEKLKGLPYTLIFYEAPHRLRVMVHDLLAVLGDRQVVLAREMTKVHEEFYRGALSELHRWVETHRLRGEMILITAGAECADSDVEGGRQHQRGREASHQTALVGEGQSEVGQERLGPPLDIFEEIQELMRAENLDLKAAVKTVANRRGMSKNKLYREYVRRHEKEEERRHG
jgi:16S rRNA (cytidine1402-2'-O)-methyltransferase